MKTTNYEISKQLAEAGFKAENDFYWAKWNEGDPELVHAKDGTPSLIEKVPAYDFETILQTLPDGLESTMGIATFVMRKNSIFYEIEQENQVPKLTFAELKEQSNWADTAARLWLKLKKQNLI